MDLAVLELAERAVRALLMLHNFGTVLVAQKFRIRNGCLLASVASARCCHAGVGYAGGRQKSGTGFAQSTVVYVLAPVYGLYTVSLLTVSYDTELVTGGA